MSVALRELRLYTEEEYLNLEDAAETKSEYWYGCIYAMAGASDPHTIINYNLNGVVYMQLRGTTCQGRGNDVKVRTSLNGLLTYPDFMIVCGKPRFLPRKNAVLLNPTAIFEILSPSTAAKDRNEKFTAYKEIESLRDYVLIAQNEARIEHWARQENGTWHETVALGLDTAITLPSTPVTLHLSEIYEDVIFGPSLFDDEDSDEDEQP